MQKSIRLGSSLALLGTVGLLAATAPSQAQTFTNGSFESGTLTGWTASSTSHVSVVTTSTDGEHAAPGTSDLYFARLVAANKNTYVTLSQTFDVLAGWSLTGSAYFQANGPDHTGNDKNPVDKDDNGYVKILDASTGAVLFSSDITAVGTNGNTGWTALLQYTFLTSGSYTIQAGVENIHDNSTPSSLGLDGVALNTIGTHAASVTPEGNSLFLLIAGGLPFAAVPVFRRRRK